MRRLKLFTLAAFALLAIGVASAPSASALFVLEKTSCDKGIAAFCWETAAEPGLKELKGEEEATFTQEEAPEPLLEALSGGVTLVHILCTSGKGSGIVSQTEPLLKATTVQGKLIFKGCKVITPATCAIAEEQKTEEVQGVLTTEDLTFKPKAGGVLLNFTFNGEKCVIKGNQPVTGEPECLWLEPEIDQQGKLCEFTHEDGGLKLGANPASLLAEFEVHFPALELTDLWDVALA